MRIFSKEVFLNDDPENQEFYEGMVKDVGDKNWVDQCDRQIVNCGLVLGKNGIPYFSDGDWEEEI